MPLSLVVMLSLAFHGSIQDSDPRPAALDRRSMSTPWLDLTRMPTAAPTPSVVTGARTVTFANGRHLRFLESRSDQGNSMVQLALDGEGDWGDPIEVTAALSGWGHSAIAMPDGRLLAAFVDEHDSSPTRSAAVLWVGTLDDIERQQEGQYTVRFFQDVRPESSVQVGVDALGRVSMQITHADGAAHRRSVPLRALDDLIPTPGFEIPLVDLDADVGRHVLVDREPGQYLGHVTTVLLEDGKTILAVYPKGHGRGGIVYKRSSDGGRTWSDRLPTPDNWSTSREVPTIHRVIDPRSGDKRLIMWSGLYPARLAVSEDDGASWSPLEQVGDWGGIVVMGFVEQLADGRYLAMFHDDGRFIGSASEKTSPVTFTLYQTTSEDGGLTWSDPHAIWSGQDVHLCEPGCIRSPDGRTLAVLLRENSRRRNSYVIFSDDEGTTWSSPRELPASLTGDRHTAKYAPDGRLFVCFRDTTRQSETQGDWVGWVGTWQDIALGRPGQYRVRLKDNKHRWDTTYPGVEVLADGTFVVTTYGHWDEGESPYILSVRFTLDELDARVSD